MSLSPHGISTPLPTELWILIFKNLELTDIKCASVVCKMLFNISRMFLFRDLHLSLDEEKMTKKRSFQIFHSKSKELADTHLYRRIKFYQSDSLINHVQTCTLCVVTPSRIVDELLLLLIHFKNLSKFEIYSLPLTPKRLHILKDLPLLDSLLLSNCNFEGLSIVDIPSLPMNSFQITCHNPTEGRHLWPLLLDPSRLQHLSVQHTYIPIQFSTTLTRLRSLRLFIHPKSAERCVTLLHSCPSLHSLSIIPSLSAVSNWNNYTLTESQPFKNSQLQTFDGPETCLQYCVGRSLLRVHLWGGNGFFSCYSENAKLKPALQILTENCSLLKSLTIAPECITRSIIASAASFPNLEEVYITSKSHSTFLSNRDVGILLFAQSSSLLVLGSYLVFLIRRMGSIAACS